MEVLKNKKYIFTVSESFEITEGVKSRNVKENQV